MARFSAADADNYGGGSGKFFSLKDHGDSATIRFMYETMDDVEGMAVHEVEVGNRRVTVECLREYHQPVDDCPFCANQIKQQVKVFIPVYNVDADAVQVWQRGKNWFQKLSSLCARYNPLVSTPIDIERQGAKGDTSTDYLTYPLEGDNTVLADLPEPLDLVEEGIVTVLTFDEMQDFLDGGQLPGQASGGRNPASDRRNAPQRRQTAPRRQTPSRGLAADQAPANPSESADRRSSGTTSRTGAAGGRKGGKAPF